MQRMVEILGYRAAPLRELFRGAIATEMGPNQIRILGTFCDTLGGRGGVAARPGGQ